MIAVGVIILTITGWLLNHVCGVLVPTWSTQGHMVR